MRKFVMMAAGLSALALSGTAQAQSGGFVNGGFENGTASGWTTGAGYRGNTLNPLNPAAFLPGGSLYDASLNTHSAVVGTGYVDPNVGTALGSAVYSGSFAYRVEDTASGGYASVISQRVNNYTDANIFFAWKAVLENGGHTPAESATMVISLVDLTANAELIRREYNAGSTGGGVDTRFTQQGNFFYTSQWQIEQLAIGAALSGHDFLLTVLAADCEPAGHEGYVFLDGFGAVTPPPVDGAVPEPATWAMMIGGFGLVGGAMRRRRQTALRFV